MNPLDIINKYYPGESELKHILLTHSRSVADKALWIADRHPELQLDRDFLYEGAMLHDIGIFLTDADSIGCLGDKPYICHGYLGADLMRSEGYPRHALVCERHTGAGLSLDQIIAQNLPCRIGTWCPSARRAGDLLCRQVLFENPPGSRETGGKGPQKPGKVWYGRSRTLRPMVPDIPVNICFTSKFL